MKIRLSILVSPYGLVFSQIHRKVQEGLFLTTEVVISGLASRAHSISALQNDSRMNLAYRSRDAFLSVYFARCTIAATFCQV
jgi:hypothetical protein